MVKSCVVNSLAIDLHIDKIDVVTKLDLLRRWWGWGRRGTRGLSSAGINAVVQLLFHVVRHKTTNRPHLIDLALNIDGGEQIEDMQSKFS